MIKAKKLSKLELGDKVKILTDGHVGFITKIVQGRSTLFSIDEGYNGVLYYSDQLEKVKEAKIVHAWVVVNKSTKIIAECHCHDGNEMLMISGSRGVAEERIDEHQEVVPCEIKFEYEQNDDEKTWF